MLGFSLHHPVFAGLALVFPNGIANVLDLTTCEVQWSGPAADIAGNDAIAKEVSGACLVA